MARPSAAQALYPHLTSDPQPQRRAQRLATLFPKPQPPPPPNPYSDRESLLRHLRALNKRVDERLAREGKR